MNSNYPNRPSPSETREPQKEKRVSVNIHNSGVLSITENDAYSMFQQSHFHQAQS